jgi:hypothetical protein
MDQEICGPGERCREQQENDGLLKTRQHASDRRRKKKGLRR